MNLIFDDPTALPHRSQPKPEFDKKMGNFYRDLPQYNTQLKALIASAQAVAAGGAYSFPYVFDGGTGDTDPGVGRLRLGSAVQNAAIAMRLSNRIVGGTDISTALTDLQSVTSSTKGSITIVKSSDPSKWMILDVTAVAVASGYRNFTVKVRVTSDGAASPFTNGDPLVVKIDRNGDSGTVPGATDLIARMNIESSVAVASLATVFDLSLIHI